MAQHATSQHEPDQEQFAGVEFKRHGYSLYVAFSDDKMECRCGYLPRHSGTMISRGELLNFLVQANVKVGIDEERLGEFLAAAAGRQTVRDAPLALGVPPAHGVDGWFSPTAKPCIRAHHEEEEGDSHDFRNVQTFINVLPGDEIGRIMPHTTGVPGRKVTGEVAIPRHGKPLKLKVGKDVRAEEDGRLLFAEAAGRVCFAFGEISVAQEFRVSGDVNFRVGSVSFNGVVEVGGDVLDGFNVTATKGLRVAGNIGNCSICSEGDVTLCGMDGQGRGSIICSGTIRANYLHDCTIECAGDVIVETEIHNCTIWTLGRIIVNRGGIVGGSCTSLGGIEAARLGSLTSVHTKLIAGVDYRDALELEQLQADLALNHKLLEDGAGRDVDTLRMARSVLTDRIMAIRSKVDPARNAKINVKTALYEKVLLTVGLTSERTFEQQTGPFTIIENSTDGGLRYLNLSSLEVNARVIEQACLRGAH